MPAGGAAETLLSGGASRKEGLTESESWGLVQLSTYPCSVRPKLLLPCVRLARSSSGETLVFSECHIVMSLGGLRLVLTHLAKRQRYVSDSCLSCWEGRRNASNISNCRDKAGTVKCSTFTVVSGEAMATIKTATLTFRIEPGLKEALRIAADLEHRSIANMVEVLIRDHCERQGIAIVHSVEAENSNGAHS